MKRTYPREQIPNVLDVLRKAGYAYFRDPQTEEESFVLRLTPEFYPRFHLYVDQDDKTITFNLHLDQKKPSYGNNHAHSGEYSGETVERELQRIDGWVRAVTRETKHLEQKDEEQMDTMKKRWWHDGLTKIMQKIFPGNTP